MKNFKKEIFMSIIILIIVFYLVYNYFNENVDEIIEEDIYIETNTTIKETNKIILHITGEVKNSRNNTNR